MRTRSIASGLAALTLLAAALSCQNINVDTEKVDPCTFDHGTGKYDEPFQLTIENDDMGVEIWYTEDGTEPFQEEGSSILYDDTIDVDRTLTVRAKGYKTGLRASNESSATFTFVWTRGADMAGVPDLQGRYDFGCVAVGSDIYVIGGREKTPSNSAQVATVLVYDTNGEAWGSVPNGISHTRQGMGAVEFNGKVYISGGSESGVGVVGTTQVFDPGTGDWTTLDTMNYPRYGHRLAVLGSGIYAFGGYDGSAYVEDVEVYDPVGNTWDIVPESEMPSPCEYFGIGVVDGKAYIFGGRYLDTELSVCSAFDPTPAIPGNFWTPMEDMPVPTWDLGSAVYDDSIIHSEESRATTALPIITASILWPRTANQMGTGIGRVFGLCRRLDRVSGLQKWGARYSLSPAGTPSARCTINPSRFMILPQTS